MNAGSGKTRDAVENIIWTDQSKLRAGRYEVRVHNFCKREHIDFGFEVEIEINGELHKFNYDKMVSDREYIAELMSINLLTFVCSLNKLTVFNFEFNTCTVIIVS